jgi:uncharacterized repeat protein (TIGR01451 family)
MATAFRTPVRLALSAAMLVLVGAAAAHAQTGPFVNAAPPWIGPIGGAGVAFQGAQIWVDVNGSDLTEVGVDTFHPIPSGLSAGTWTLSLTPSRRIMVARAVGGEACPGQPAVIRLYTIPALNGAALVQLGTERTLARCLAGQGYFDDPNRSVRTAFFREDPHPTTGQYNILWFDLVTGVSGYSSFQFSSNFGSVKFAPYGTMALVQHEVNGAQGTRYSMLLMCPASLGAITSPQLDNRSGIHTATVESGPGDLVAVVRSTGFPDIVYPYSDCALPPPATGACCLPGGGCIGATAAECASYSGAFAGAGTECATANCPPAPTPLLGVTLAGPDTAQRGSEVTYTLTARNDGALASSSVILRNTLPGSTSFVSASHGGTEAFGVVTWNIGTLGPSSSVQRTFTVQTPCFLSSIANTTYSISGTPGGTVNGSPPWETQLQVVPTTMLQSALSSQAQAPTPLRTGDRSRHTVTLTNTLAQPRDGVRFTMNAGLVSQIVEIVNAGGGTVNNFNTLFEWTGTLAPMGTVQIIYETEILQCRNDVATEEQMNRGQWLLVLNHCGGVIGIMQPPPAIPVAPSPLMARLVSTSNTPEHGWGGTSENRFVLARPGSPVTFELRVINSEATPAPVCSVAVWLPPELVPTGNPPFVGTPPEGTTWDAAQSLIIWKGQPPADDSVRVIFGTTLAADVCSAEINANGGFGACLGVLTSSLRVMVIAQPPADGHLTSLNAQTGLRTLSPAGGNNWKPLACGSFSSLRGMGRAPDGTFWVIGQPSFRVNPQTMDFALLPDSFFNALDMDLPYDVGVDIRDSSLVFVGYRSGFGLRVRRYHPVTGQITTILNNVGAIAIGRRVEVGTDGLMIVVLDNRLLRIPPANPNGYSQFTSAGVNDMAGLATDVDGHVLVAEASFGPGTRRLFKVNRDTGVFTTVLDLDPLFPPSTRIEGVTTAPDQNVYVGDALGTVNIVVRSQGNGVLPAPTADPVKEFIWVGPAGPPLATDTPERPATLSLAVGPNPFRRATTLRWALPAAAAVRLDVFDLGGRRVRSLVSGASPAGRHATAWDGADDDGKRLGAGIYFAWLSAGKQHLVTRIVRLD